MDTKAEAVELIRALTETLARAELELVSPGSCRKYGWDIRQEINETFNKADAFLEIEDGEKDEADTRAISRRLGLHLRLVTGDDPPPGPAAA
jgi:hypothetical protein